MAFQILTTNAAVFISHLVLDDGVTSIKRGHLVRYDATAGGWVLGNDANGAQGLAYDFLSLQEFPTTDNLATYLAGKPMTVATGTFLALVPKSYFASGSLPTDIGTLLASADNGLLAVAGAGDHVVGRYLGAKALRTMTGGTEDHGLVLFHFTPPTTA